MQLKNDTPIFLDVIQKLQQEPWMGPNKWCPKFLFHFTDVKNAIQILTNNRLYSREMLRTIGGMANENASPDVINHTEDKWKSFVRFYFRPRTPTQYHNEGFRPTLERPLGGANCPMPIFFLFSSIPLLTMKQSKFSYKSLALSDAVAYETGEMFREMPFHYIYHDGSYDSLNQSYIKHHRHAEVIIPDSCGLEHLEYIVCRSQAERDTLITQLNASQLKTWEKKIIVDSQGKFFYSHWTYVDKASLSEDRIILHLNKGNRVKGVFNSFVSILETATGIEYTSTNTRFAPSDQISYDLINLKHSRSYTVRFYLDNDLAYFGKYIHESELPF